MQVATSIIVLTLCIGAFIYSDIKSYKERKLRGSLAIATVVGTNAISALQFIDNQTAVKSLADLQKVETDIINSAIIDNKGNVFAQFSQEGHLPYKFVFPKQDQDYRFEDNYLYVSSIIKKDNEALGAVCLKIELLQLEDIKKQMFNIALALGIIGVGLAFLIAIILQTYISRPLLYLVRVMRNIREKEDYKQHVTVKGKDEISRLSLEFNSLMDEVVKSHQKKDEFIGVASHELKTPLTSIKAYLQLLEKIEEEQPNKTYLKKAQDNVAKLQQLIFDLLDVSKIQAGQLRLDIKEFDIDQLVDECVNDARLNSTHHHVIRLDGRAGRLIKADRQRIEQVLINLLSNAIKYSPTGVKDIIVDTQKVGTEVIVSIKDFGVGVPKSEEKKIFERFYRSSGNLFGISGFGLGLYICNEIIKRHNGRLWLESEEGKGSTFSFALPLEGPPKS